MPDDTQRTEATMSSRPWTEGPWMAHDGGAISAVALNKNVATTDYRPFTSKRAADAALIALAPELAEAILAPHTPHFAAGTCPACNAWDAAAEKLRAIIREHGGEA